MKSKAYYQERDNAILSDLAAGMTWDEAADKYHITRDAIRHICNKVGINNPQYNKTKKQQEIENRRQIIIEMRLAGKSYSEIADIVGYASVTPVQQICQQAELGKEWKFEQKAVQIRGDRIKGLSFNEIAEKYHVGYATVAKACKGMPEPENIKELRKRGVLVNGQRMKNVATEKYCSYLLLQGFIDPKRDGDYYTAKCQKCGAEIKLSQSTLKHHVSGIINEDIQCRNCTVLIPKIEMLEAKLKAKFKRQDEQILKIINKKTREAKRDMRLHPCPVCGKMTTNRKYCSAECQKKAQWATNDAKRRSKIKMALIDKDISLQKLYERDHGVCHICGGLCDYDDCETKNGVFLVGYQYPSIDHVVPLARGGKHSWDNVKLAHWRCNSLKRDNMPA